MIGHVAPTGLEERGLIGFLCYTHVVPTGLRGTMNNETKDMSWREIWDIAVRSKKRLFRNNTDDFREQIVETARGHAYWRVWMKVFEDDPDMRRRFIEAFPGTAEDCFDDTCQPVQRPGGQI